jgi:hypothetical protein
MKNNNSLTNYSILVLVLLVLILIYIHIPNPPNVMRGGASSDIQNMIKNDGIYSNTLGHPIMQWVILVVFIILIYLAYETSLTAFAWTGAPVLGINGLVDSYTISGPGFLKKFYQLTQDTLVLRNGIGGKEPLYPEDMETYKNGIVDFKTSMDTQIKIFCNETIKCNNCECPGAMKDKNINSKCKPNSGDKGGRQATALRTKNETDAAEKFMGFIPKCCCLDKIIVGGYTYVRDPFDAQDFTNDDLWKVIEKNTTNGIKYNTYEWIGGEDGLSTATAVSTAKLNGCDTTGGTLVEKDNEGTITKSKDIDTTVAGLNGGCTCNNNDPTLNYYNHKIKAGANVLDANKKLVISDAQKLKLKANLFAKWGAEKEKTYRLKSDNPAAKLYDFPVDYYTDSTKTIFKSDCLVDGYILAGKKDGDKIVCDKSKWTSDTGPSSLSSNSKAVYMINENKYFYHLPNSTFSKPSLFEPPDDFKKAIEEQKKAIEDEKNAPTDGFFGGIYNYIFPVKK